MPNLRKLRSADPLGDLCPKPGMALQDHILGCKVKMR